MLIQYQIPWMVHFPRLFFVFVPLQALRVICEKALFFNKKAFDKMRRKNKIGYLIPVILLYMVVDSGILKLWIRNVSFSDYLVFYNPRAAGILQSILNTLGLVNIVMFIVFLVVTLRYQMDKTERIMRLNEELTVANIKLEEYSRTSAEMAQMQERNRLAREIHDTIGHALTGIVTGLEACFVLLDSRPDLARQQMKSIQNVARKGM